MTALGFVFFHILAFLFPYLLSTVFLLGRFWWVPIAVLIVGSTGGGTAIYNQDGKQIGTLND